MISEGRCADTVGTSTFEVGAKDADPASTLNWTALCQSGIATLFDPASGTVYDPSSGAPLTSKTVVLSVPQPKLGFQTVCDVLLTVQDAAGLHASCSQSIMVAPCDLGCTSTDIGALLLALDGNTLGQRKVVEELVRNLRSVTTKKAAQVELTSAMQSYDRSWAIAWSLPVIFNTCTNTTACVSVASAPVVEQYLAEVENLRAIADKLVKKLRRVGASKRRSSIVTRADRLKKKVKKAFDTSVAETQKVPISTSVCS